MQTFNPVYIKDTLKDSNYLEVTSMIRAAAKNFSGNSNEAPIWEDNAFLLTKNIVIYCSTCIGYFTLSDCYTAMLKADTDELINELKESIKLELAEIETGITKNEKLIENEQSAQTKDEIILIRKGNEKKNTNKKKVGKRRFDEEEVYNIRCAIQFFKEYRFLEEKFKSGVLVTSTTFLNQFQDFNAAKMFCPEWNALTIKSMDDIVDGGKILLFNVKNEALARSMGTFIKLHYQRSVLNRLKDPNRSTDTMAVLIADEYQDLVSIGQGGSIGDDKICAKGREANFFFLAASQSLISIYKAIGNEKAAKELIQNFRTRIACHSSDIETIRNFKELMGQEEVERTSHSVSENSQKTTRNFLLGGFDSKDANINESISTSQQKEHIITGKEFSKLKSFEAFAQVYDGIETKFYKLFLKPSFLKSRRTKHKKVLMTLKDQKSIFSIAGLRERFLKYGTTTAFLILFFLSNKASAFPNVCSVINTVEFNSCLNFRYHLTTCGSWPFIRPCYRFSYMVPQTFIEVSPNAGSSYFTALPGAAVQLASAKALPPFGTENDEDTQSYHSRTLSVPFAQIPFNMLPCGGTRMPKLCFDGMSEHIAEHWSTGMSDKYQPNFLAWSLAPKACLIKGAVTSATGGTDVSFAADSPMCSIKLPPLPSFPPSTHSSCNGWGIFYPRMGSYNGPASLTGALMIASRMKSISSEVFMATPSTFGEKWQMIGPGSSSCFREGQNIGLLDTVKNVREIGRLTSGKLNGHLFVVWKPVTCKKDIPYLATSQAAIAAMKPMCTGFGK